ncbi:hypothetical protein COV13_03660 [Candidatus Woesearchaeota archaeon CG10_big_fil_rev_8_21_14_0_10_32_9]|nr:MAG: hypothetical protein COV13_03660 [Candidatus Woesearchaeota archaeon CG10_big_fil_rev_8_21_14_0_10_32_9]
MGELINPKEKIIDAVLNVSIKDVLTEMFPKLTFREAGDGLYDAFCPLHEVDSFVPQLYVRGPIYHCYSCSSDGDITDLCVSLNVGDSYLKKILGLSKLDDSLFKRGLIDYCVSSGKIGSDAWIYLHAPLEGWMLLNDGTWIPED